MAEIQNIHHNSIRKYTAGLLDLFNDVEIQYKKTNDEYIIKPIPIKYSIREKATLIDQYTSEQILSGNYNVLPKGTLSLVSLSKIDDRITNKNNKINKFKNDQMMEFSYNSVSYRFSYDMIFQCRGMNEASQIIEQIAVKFNPIINIDIWDATNLNEPTRIPVVLENISIENEDYDEFSTNINTITFNLSVVGNLYQPIKSLPRVKEFIMNFDIIKDAEYAKREDMIDWDVVDAIPTNPNLSVCEEPEEAPEETEAPEEPPVIPGIDFIALPNGTIHFTGDASMLNEDGVYSGLGDDGNTYKAYNNTKFRDMIDRFNQGEDIGSELDYVCTTLVTDMSGLFVDLNTGTPENTGGLSFNYPRVSTWDTRNVTTLFGTFGFSDFNQPLNAWDVSKVTNMASTFWGTPFNQPLDQWDVSNVTDMRGILAETPFNQDISNWNVSNVTLMTAMFGGSQFNGDVSNWDVSKVTDMNGMFSETPFNQNILQWDVSNVTNMDLMFKNTPFNQDISNWNVSNVTRMNGVFLGSQFNQSLANWDVSKVTNVQAMFEGTPFNQDISGWDISSITSMDNMFKNSLFDQDISGWDVSGVLQCSNFATNAPICGTSKMPTFNLDCGCQPRNL